jgi:hypothetical protein
MLEEAVEPVLIRKLPGEDPLDPPFRCAEYYLGYIIVGFISKVRILEEAIEPFLVRKLLGGDPLDPPFRYAEHYPGYITVEFINKVRPAD